MNGRFSRKGIAILAFCIFFLAFPSISGTFGMGTSNYLIAVMTIVFMYAFLGEAWNLLAGYCGQFSLGHSLFFGIGAYTMTLVYFIYRVNLFLGLLVGVVANTLIALVIAAASFRVRGVFFSMLTLTAAYVGLLLFGEYTYMTIDGVNMGGWWAFTIPTPLDNVYYYYFFLILALASVYMMYRIEKSRLGYQFLSIREDEDLARSLGINTYRNKIVATVISCVLTGIAGSLYAQYASNIEPYSIMDVSISFYILIGAVIGGLGTKWGPIIGALAFYLFTSLIRTYMGGAFVGVTEILGGVIIVVMTLGLDYRIRHYLKSYIKKVR